MSILVLTSDTLIGTPATGNLEYNGQFFGTDSNASRAQLQRLVLETSKASTSGTSVDFTGIPAWVKRVTVMMNGVSKSSTANFLFQLGAGGSVENTGYIGNAVGSLATNTVIGANSSAGFPMVGDASGASIVYGSISFLSFGSNLWIANGLFTLGLAGYNTTISGTKTLSATLDRVRITTTGSDTFDAGSINILYEG